MHCTAPDIWLSLALAPGLGPVTCKTLFCLLGAEAPQRWLPLLQSCQALSAPALQTVHEVLGGQLPVPLQREREACLQWSAQPGCSVLTLASAAYPPLLFEVPDPPPVLFVRGHPEVLHLPQIAMVGSRRPSADGLRHARRFAGDLVAAGYQIVSGLALGIDTASHQGALAAEGVTIAVQGAGMDQIYPRQNTRLAQQIAERGAVLSELPPFMPALPANFPQRNRIISGLAHGVLVIEAAEQSGSLITARLAAAQGREVFALPGSINNPMARGCHRLLRQGAKLVETVADVLEELPALLRWEKTRSSADSVQASPAVGAAPDASARKLLNLVAYDPVPLDALALRSDLPVAELQSRLTLLELQGLICLQPGGYVRTANCPQT